MTFDKSLENVLYDLQNSSRKSKMEATEAKTILGTLIVF